MESWRQVWNMAAPLLPTRGLEALKKAMEGNDPTLIQGVTSEPLPLACYKEYPVEGACLLGFCGWQDGRETVGETEEFFAKLCYDIDQKLGESAGCRWLLNWWDESPREEVRKKLLPLVQEELNSRLESN